jgi:hypothetical protein
VRKEIIKTRAASLQNINTGIGEAKEKGKKGREKGRA